MESAKNLFRATAHLYDLDPTLNAMDDVRFYIERAGMYPGNVLELACGTGRITVPLAQAGNRVWGVDLSMEMLARLENKLKYLPTEIRSRINCLHSDMCDFDIDEKFSLIFIPFRSFQVLTRAEQQKSCFERVRKHLAGNGRFIINVFKPYSFLDESWITPETFRWEVNDPETGNKVKRTEYRKAIDVENQIIYPELIYYVTDGDGTETRIIEPLVMKYYYEEQMKGLLVSNGFIIEEEMGYYDGRPIKEGGELIFVCAKQRYPWLQLKALSEDAIDM